MAVLATLMALVVPYGGEQGSQSDRVQPRPLVTEHRHVRRDGRWRIVRPLNAKLNRIAYCESSMRWHINTGNGFFGGLQFTRPTWRSVGGRGLPHWWSALEQKFRAVKVYKRRGSWADWPVCGFR